jgi:hypothetical protein
MIYAHCAGFYYLTPEMFPAQHCSIFPLALGQILREHAIPEFHLPIGSGKWDYDLWGHPGEQGVGSGGALGVNRQRDATKMPSRICLLPSAPKLIDGR